MAGLGAATFRMLENFHSFAEQSKFFKPKNSRISSESENYSYSNSFPSRESSIDLTPDENLEPLLKKKHSKVEFLSESLKFFDHLSCFSGFIGLLFSLLSCELSEKDYYRVQIMLIISFVFTGLLIFSLFKSWKIYFELLREKKMFHEGSHKTFIRSAYFKYLLLETFVYFIQPIPFLEVNFLFYQLSGVLFISLNEILTSLSLVRVFLFLKLLRHHSKWTNQHSSAICDLYAAKATEKYALKALLIEKPVELMIPLLGLSVTIFSLALRIYERKFVSDSGTQDYHYLWNSMWLISLTMTTVGFGDFYPKTHPGRFIAALSACWGIFLVSLIILTLTNFSHFNPAQQRSYNFLKRVKIMNTSQNYATQYVAAVVEILVLSAKGKYNQRNVSNLVKVKTLFKKFKYYKNFYLRTENSPQEMLRIINEELRIIIDKFEWNIREAKDFHEQLETLIESQERSIEALKASCKDCRDVIWMCCESSNS